MKNLFFYILVFLVWSCNTPSSQNGPEEVKVAIREVGHQLLLSQKDSVSLVLPVEFLSPSSYKLNFQKGLSLKPNDLANIVKRTFEKAALTDDYLVEVSQCEDEKVTYSYQVYRSENIEIIPCSGRQLPEACYSILINFTNKEYGTVSWVWLAGVAVLALLGFIIFKRPLIQNPKSRLENNNSISLGSFMFYPEQLKLVKQATEITVSRKECELLELFVERPNQLITREELTKRIWEDNGVIVGRSLDTYVSKLRKKLQGDANIKITNVHGVGYKLEVTP